MSQTIPTASPLAFTSAPDSRQFLQQELERLQGQLLRLTPANPILERAELHFRIGEVMLEIAHDGMPEAAWGLTKEAFMIYQDHQQWEDAVRCCDLLFRTGLPHAVPALGNGLWLAITYPINPEITVLMLNNLIEATPDTADGAAVAAAVAHYIVDMRLEGEKRESTLFLTSALLGKVAERHSQVDSQEKMDRWLEKLGLLDPAIFLPRMGMVIDALVDGQWWYDRDVLRSQLPVN